MKEVRVIHDSLSKFKHTSQPQPGDTYHLGGSGQDQLYKDTLNKNDEIAVSLINSKIVLGSKKRSSRSEAKELLFHLNKNRSMNSKKVESKKIELDRYKSIQEPTEFNLKFPIIDRKNMVTLDVQTDKVPFLD